MNNTQLKAYYKEIEKLLVCDRKQKNAFISELKANIDDYVSNCPEADIDKIKAEFGTPEIIAESFLSNSDAIAIRKKLNIKKCILIALAIALIIYLAFVVISLIDVHTEAHGYMQESIMMISALKGGVGL